MDDARRKQHHSVRFFKRGRDGAGGVDGARDGSDRPLRRCKVTDRSPRRYKVSKALLRRCQVSKAPSVAAHPLRCCQISVVSCIK
ncbi:hypothetical protein ACLOJK_026871 [Asimina triloba]